MCVIDVTIKGVSISVPIQTQVDQSLLLERVQETGLALKSTLSEVLSHLPPACRSTVELSHTLKISKDSSSRLLRGLSKDDATAALLTLPGPSPLRNILSAARCKGVPDDVVHHAEGAVLDLELLIRDEFGDRVSLDSMICSMLPEEQLRQETINKQLVYRGMSQLRGASVDTLVNSAILMPSADKNFLDGAWIMGWFGLRRIRPGASVQMLSARVGEQVDTRPDVDLRGLPFNGNQAAFIEPFCSKPLPPIRIELAGVAVQYSLGESLVGLRGSVDVVLGSLTTRCLKAVADQSRPRLCGPTMEITTPARQAVFDVWVHKQIHSGRAPELRIFDTTIRGLADMNDPSRAQDRCALQDRIEFLGSGTSGALIADVQRYRELIDYSLRQLGFSAADFVVYRCRSDYPMYGAQYCFGFSGDWAPG
jgi:hypothetical protein